jgi:hypothetical protein
MSEEKISVFTKKKNVQLLIEYCLENKLQFSISPKSNDDFEVVFDCESLKAAVALGMCLKELKLELSGMTSAYTTVAALKNSRKTISPIESNQKIESDFTKSKKEDKEITEDIFGGGLQFDIEEKKN